MRLMGTKTYEVENAEPPLQRMIEHNPQQGWAAEQSTMPKDTGIKVDPSS